MLDNKLEHLDHVFLVLFECHRILKKDGILKIIVPYRMRNLDIFHKHFFDEHSLNSVIFNPKASQSLQNINLFVCVEKKIICAYRYKFFPFNDLLGSIDKKGIFGKKWWVMWKLKKHGVTNVASIWNKS